MAEFTVQEIISRKYSAQERKMVENYIMSIAKPGTFRCYFPMADENGQAVVHKRCKTYKFELDTDELPRGANNKFLDHRVLNGDKIVYDRNAYKRRNYVAHNLYDEASKSMPEDEARKKIYELTGIMIKPRKQDPNTLFDL